MFVSLKANKKRIIAFLVLVVVVVGACFLLRGGKAEEEVMQYTGATNEERVAFLQSFGWQVETDPAEMREVMIPEEFNDVYTTYNEMQKSQGFDLAPYAGYKCIQYKYKILNYPDGIEVYATLLVYDTQILGGDLACSNVDGFMHGFAVDSMRYGEKNYDPNKAKDNTVSIPEGNTAAESSAPAENDENAAGNDNTGNAENAENTDNAESAVTDTEDTTEPAGDDTTADDTAANIIDEGAFPTD